LSLVDARGDASSGRLSVRVVERSTSFVADALERARALEQSLSRPEVTQVSGVTTSLADAASNQAGLATSLGSVLDKIGILVKLGDEVAKVCHCSYNYSCFPEILADSSLC
jgi:hypothetical protein